jgi:hypothetical protein
MPDVQFIVSHSVCITFNLVMLHCVEVWHYCMAGILLCLKTCLKTYHVWYEILICIFSYHIILYVIFSNHWKMVHNLLLYIFIPSSCF